MFRQGIDEQMNDKAKGKVYKLTSLLTIACISRKIAELAALIEYT